MRDELGAPNVVDRSTLHAGLDALPVREKAHTREGGATALIGERGAVTFDVFEGRRMLIAYYFMGHTGHPAPEQCQGCTWLHRRSASYPGYNGFKASRISGSMDVLSPSGPTWKLGSGFSRGAGHRCWWPAEFEHGARRQHE